MKTLSSPFDLIKKAINIFFKKENLVYFVKIYLLMVPFAIVTILQGQFAGLIKNLPEWLSALIVIIQLPLRVFVSTFVLAAGIEAVGKVAASGDLSVKSTFAVARRKYWPFLLLVLILDLIYLLGFILLIIPGMLAIVWLAFARFIAMDSNLGIKRVLIRSKEMTKGFYWKILGRLLVFGVFAFSVQLLSGFLPYGTGQVLTALAGALFLLPTYLLYKEISA